MIIAFDTPHYIILLPLTPLPFSRYFHIIDIIDIFDAISYHWLLPLYYITPAD